MQKMQSLVLNLMHFHSAGREAAAVTQNTQMPRCHRVQTYNTTFTTAACKNTVDGCHLLPEVYKLPSVAIPIHILMYVGV